MQEFTKYLKKKLEGKGISINKLSEEIRVRDVYLRDILAGRRVSFPTIHKISEYLNDPYLVYLYVFEKLLNEKRKSKKSSSKNSKKEV
jgi:transcriptional regulator with XRE-family HTH domain